MILRLYHGWSENTQHKNIFASQTRRQNFMQPLLTMTLENTTRLFDNFFQVEVQNDEREALLSSNYLIQKLDGIDREYCYYIDEITQISSRVYNIYVHLDAWETFAADMTVRGYLTQTTEHSVVPVRYNTRYLPLDKGVPCGIPEIEELFTDTNFYCIAVYGTYGGTQTVVLDSGIGGGSFPLYTALDMSVFNAPLSTKIKLSSSPDFIDCVCLKVFVVPESFLSMSAASRSCELKGSGDMSSLVTNAWEYDGSSKILRFTITDNMFDEHKHVFIGSIANRVELPTFDKPSWDGGRIYVDIGYGDISIYIDFNGQRLELTNDYEMPLVYSDAAQKMLENRTAFAIKTTGNIIGAATSALSQNYVGLTMSALSQAKSTAEYISTRYGGATVSGNANASITLTNHGIALFKYDTLNKQEIENEIHHKGYKYANARITNLNLKTDISTSSYFRFSNVELWGTAQDTARREIEATFERGVYIHFYADE